MSDDKDLIEFDYEPDAPKRAKPDISHLEDALSVDDAGNVTFLPQVGGKVVIERCLESGSWLDTNLYTITDVDRQTGDLRLVRDEMGHRALSNYMEGIIRGYVFKLPPKKGPITGRKVRVKKAKPEKKTIAVPDPNASKRARGRPKGSKNRPREVVAADRAAKVQGKARKVV
jgi:hypothetical protein